MNTTNMVEHVTEWFNLDLSELILIGLSTVCVYSGIILYTRLTGLRSFSKMSASDFAMTIAVGSLFGGAIVNPKPTVLAALAALAFLFFMQWLFAWIRRHTSYGSKVLDNTPVLLMRGSSILENNLQQVNMTHGDLYAKLREANVSRFDQVLAVVFEATGDVSVLHTTDPEFTMDTELLKGVENEP